MTSPRPLTLITLLQLVTNFLLLPVVSVVRVPVLVPLSHQGSSMGIYGGRRCGG